MTDDLKQRADAAWGSVHLMRSIADPIQRAVEASIAAALAPVLERVAFVETLLKTKPEFASAYAQKQPPPVEAKCSECGGPDGGDGWICGPWWNPNLGTSEHDGVNRKRYGLRGCSMRAACKFNRRPCPACSKPEPDEDPREVGYPPDMAAPSAQKAPERIVRYWEDHGFLWETEQRIGTVRVEYVRADVHTRECSTQRLIGLKESEGIHAKTAALLAAANARVEELERIAEGAIGIGRREGREAGIREAAKATSFGSSEYHVILALLGKTGEK
jgi:hypothetical protein